MDWYFVCLAPKKTLKIKTFPCNVGRNPLGVSSISFDDPSMSRTQFSLDRIMGRVFYVNKSQENPATVDGKVVHGKVDPLEGAHETDAQPVQQRAAAEHQDCPESFPEYLAEGLSPQQCGDTQEHHQRHRYRNHALIGPHTTGGEQRAR